MSDNFDVNAATPKRLKEWLRSNNVTNVWMGDNPTHAELRAAVIRRRRRLQLESALVYPPHGVFSSMSLSEFVKKTSEMQEKCYGPKSNVSLNAKCIQIELPLVVLRHSKDCRGQIKHGVCRHCKQEVNEIDGDLSFYMAFELQDLDNKDVFHTMMGYGGAAKSIFGPDVTPEYVRDMEKKIVRCP